MSIRQLASVGDGPIGSSSLAEPKNLRSNLVDLLLELNGFYAFESALLVRGDGDSAPEPGIRSWSANDLWRDRFDGLADGLVFFAEDVFGVQFALNDKDVVSFDPETGETEALCQTIDEWAELILQDYEFMTGYTAARDWQQVHGSLPRGHRLVPKQPFVLGGDFSISNLYPMEATKSMRMRADMAVQLRDLPDGATVKLRVVD